MHGLVVRESGNAQRLLSSNAEVRVSESLRVRGSGYCECGSPRAGDRDAGMPGCRECAALVSAGAGEDISFDVAMVNFFKAKVVLVDPTPRAVDHYNKVASRFGKAGERPHEVGGRQEPESYELTNCSRENLLLVSQALWNDQTELQFYKPKNREHVSHSINNFQNRYKNDGEHIIVSANTLKNIMEEVNVSEKISLLKLDIEGAEHEVIESMLSDQIRPKQLLVEYDELRTFSTQGRARVQRTHRSLLGNGYQLLHCDDGYNFLYYREN